MKKGLRVDISLEDVRIDSPFGVKWYLWLPTKDHTAPKQDQLEAGVNCIQSVMDTKNKVYVHCMNGHGRAPTLVAAYFVSIGMSVKDAVEFIKCKRPEIHINKSQINCLKQFKKRHANK